MTCDNFALSFSSKERKPPVRQTALSWYYFIRYKPLCHTCTVLFNLLIVGKCDYSCLLLVLIHLLQTVMAQLGVGWTVKTENEAEFPSFCFRILNENKEITPPSLLSCDKYASVKSKYI